MAKPHFLESSAQASASSDAADPGAVARALITARRGAAPLPAADWAHALHTSAEAYAAQDAVAAAFGWFYGAPPRHWKSGGPNRDAALTHAALPPLGVRASPAALHDWPLHARAIEAEIALRLGIDVSAADAAALTDNPTAIDGLIDAMAVSIEVVDSRWREGGQAPALLRLADLQSHGALALGEWLPYARRDWSAQACEVRIGAEAPSRHRGSHTLQDPAWLLPQWLRHVTRHGATAQAGTVVTTGTWCGLLPAQRGDEVRVVFEGVGHASLRL